MSGIIPIPTSRVGDLFVRQRLTSQVQRDQLDLFRLQNQISTGRRLQLPSDDAPAAMRAINLQRLLDRKGQIRNNLEASNLYLGEADGRLQNVSNELIRLRGEVVGVAGNVSSNEARQGVMQTVDSVLQLLVDAGNANTSGRYLFAGSRSQSQPYSHDGAFVEYSGNEGVLRSYVDLERLFETSLAGTDVFGGISAAVEGSVDLNPQLTADTLVSTLNGGNGIGRNPAITVSVDNGISTVSNIVDLSGAVTVGDVARLIEIGAPGSGNVTAEVTGGSLVLRAASGTIRVTEVAEGRTARLLGVLQDPNLPSVNTITSTDLNPSLLKTTPLSNLFGTKAKGVIGSASLNDNLLITASQNGTAYNNLTVEFVTGATVGNEVATYNQGTNTLTVTIEPGVSSANAVAAAITAEGHFSAQIDYHDTSSTAQAGTETIELGTFTNVTSGGGGNVLDTESGLHLTNAGQSVELDISSAETIEDLLNLINGADLGLQAELNSGGDGINVRSRISGADFMIGENGGTTATQLGIRTYTGGTKLADLNRGLGVPTSSAPSDDLLIVARNGTQLSVDLAGATTVQQVLDRINSHANNVPPIITAQLARVGNGIELIDSSAGAGTLSVQTVEGSQAAQYLGFVASGQTQSDSADVTTEGANQVLKSEDRNSLETHSVFNTLLRLRTALETNNTEEIGQSLEKLDTDMSRINFARAEIGGRLQNLQTINVRLEDENVQLQTALSKEVDVDLIEAISQLTARQYAFEASLRSAASLTQMTLLNFL
jgi:flagellar hook-associated protein 3 FlgL